MHVCLCIRSEIWVTCRKALFNRNGHEAEFPTFANPFLSQLCTTPHPLTRPQTSTYTRDGARLCLRVFVSGNFQPSSDELRFTNTSPPRSRPTLQHPSRSSFLGRLFSGQLAVCSFAWKKERCQLPSEGLPQGTITAEEATAASEEDLKQRVQTFISRKQEQQEMCALGDCVVCVSASFLSAVYYV